MTSQGKEVEVNHTIEIENLDSEKTDDKDRTLMEKIEPQSGQTAEEPPESSPRDHMTEKPTESSSTDHTTEQHTESWSTDHTTEQHTESWSTDHTTEQHTESSSTDHTTEQHTESSSTDHTTEQHTESSSTDHTTEQHTELSSTDHTTEHLTDILSTDETGEEATNSLTIDQTTEDSEEPRPETKSEDQHNGQDNGVNCWPERVVVTGPGLVGGFLGTDFQFHIDARKAGPGVLTAFCQGASRRSQCELQDQQNGTFTLVVKPLESGNQFLEVKYGDEPVKGSPFTFRVVPNTTPDPKKVRVSGSGVENGVLSTFQSKFVVDTLGAGAGNLSVRMQGPRGAFQMEMHRANQGDRNVLCYYNPTCTGVYIIFVKWSGVNVPGSPFHVKIFDSELEMKKDARGHK